MTLKILAEKSFFRNSCSKLGTIFLRKLKHHSQFFFMIFRTTQFSLNRQNIRNFEQPNMNFLKCLSELPFNELCGRLCKSSLPQSHTKAAHKFRTTIDDMPYMIAEQFIVFVRACFCNGN